MTPIEISLGLVISYMTGVFSGIIGGIHLRKRMMESLHPVTSVNHVNHVNPPDVVAVPSQSTSEVKQEIIIRQVDG